MRLFVALELPLAMRLQLATLSGGVPGARWVKVENYHLTLRFIGEVPPFRAEEIDWALSELKARQFPLQLAGIGMFEKAGRVTSIWVGVVRDPRLDLLQAKIETALQRIGFDPERRRFAPHVTLARLDRPVTPKTTEFVQRHSLFRSDTLLVTYFTLFSSRLGKESAAYYSEAEYYLLPSSA